MTRIKIDLDDEMHERLAALSIAERRPLVWQAEVTLRRALGLPFPEPCDASLPCGDPDTGRPAEATNGNGSPRELSNAVA